jgi:hypothetical protein
MDKTLEHMLREIDTLPEGEQARIARVLEREVRKARRAAPAPAGRWARLVERMRRDAPMAGKSEELLRQVREFREHFDLRIKPAGE